MIRRWCGTLAFTLLLTPIAARAGDAEIEHRCTVQYPNIMQYFSWKDCVKAETQRETEKNALRQAEAARLCIAGDISRMEGLAQRVKAAVTSDTSLEDSQSALEKIVGQRGQILISDDSTKERVLVTAIRSNCLSSFRLVIKVHEGPDKKLRWLSILAKDAPSGYSGSLHPEVIDFEQQRDEKRERDADAQFWERMAAIEKEREEEQRKKVVNNIKISNVKVKCVSARSCSMRFVEFVLTNVSNEPAKEISLGYVVLPSQSAGCPTNLATKEDLDGKVLQPGEKMSKTITISNGPDNRDAKLCLGVTGLRGP